MPNRTMKFHVFKSGVFLGRLYVDVGTNVHSFFKAPYTYAENYCYLTGQLKPNSKLKMVRMY